MIIRRVQGMAGGRGNDCVCVCVCAFVFPAKNGVLFLSKSGHFIWEYQNKDFLTLARDFGGGR